MKHLLSLERLDVGRTLALTVGSPSAHRRGTMLKHIAVLVLILTLGLGQVWAAVTGSIASSISDGDQVILVNTSEANEFTGVSSSNTGSQASYNNKIPNGTCVLTVETGKYGSGNYSLKLSDGSYLAYTTTATSSNNKLWKLTLPTSPSDDQKKQVSWTISFNASNEVTITNVYNTGRKLRFNSDRFCCYTSNQTAVKFFKLSGTNNPTALLVPTGISSGTPGMNGTTLSWNPVDHAEGYALTIGTDDPITTGFETVNNKITYTLNDLESETTYTWKVKATTTDTEHYSNSADCATQQFETAADPNLLKVVYDFTKTSDYPTGFPSSGNQSTSSATEYTFGGNALVLYAPNNFYRDGSHLFFGKTATSNNVPTGAYIEFPARSNYKLTKVVLHENSGAANGASLNIWSTTNVAMSTAVLSTDVKDKDATFVLTNPAYNTAYRITAASSNINLRFDKITLTYAPKPAVSSISIKTAPTKKTYTANEHFDPSGLVITVNYEGGSSEDVTYSNTTASDFSFTPTTSTALNATNNSVTVTYGTKTANQAITVNRIATSLEWQKGGNAVSSYSANLDDTYAFPTLATTPANLSGVTFESSNTDVVETISSAGVPTVKATGTTTITAKFAQTNVYAAATDASYTLTINAANSPSLEAEPMALAFDPTAVSENRQLTFNLYGFYLTADASLEITGDDKDMFSVASSVAKDANDEIAEEVTVTYAPTAAGNHSATLTISSAGATSVEVAISGQAKVRRTVTWYKGDGEELSAQERGSATTSVLDGDAVTAIPAAPASCDDAISFMGWTDAPYAKNDAAPAPLYTALGDFPAISGSDATYYAVWAEVKASNGSVVITYNSTNFPTTYAAAQDYELEGYTFNILQVYKNGEKMQWRKSGDSNGTGTMYNKGVFPGHISSIVVEFDASDSNKNHTLKIGNAANPTEGTSITPSVDGNTYTFDCSAYSYDYFVLTNGANAGYTSSVTINYAYSSIKNYTTNCVAPVVITDPTFDVAGGTYNVTKTVKVNNYNSNYYYFYTLDGTTPAADANLQPTGTAAAYNHTTGIAINESCTLKVIAYDADANTSDVTSATYTLNLPLTLAQFVAQKPTTDKEIDLTDAIVLGAQGKFIYLQQGEAAMALYNNTPASWVKGNKVTGIITGKYTGNYNVPEMQVSSFGTATATGSFDMPTPLEITEENAEELLVESNMYRYAEIKDVNFGVEDEYPVVRTANEYYYFDDALSVITGKVLPESTVSCDVKGIIYPYKSSGVFYYEQLAPIALSDITAKNAIAVLPTISPTGGASLEAAEAEVEYLSAVSVQLVENEDIYVSINDETATKLTEAASINIEGDTKIAVTAKRDFYADNTVTYYYKPSAYPKNISVTSMHGEVVVKVNQTTVSTALPGTPVTFTVTPENEHFHITSTSVTYEGGSLTPSLSKNVYSFTMPDKDATIVVNYTEDTKYSITFNGGGAEGVGPTAIENQYAGAEITLPTKEQVNFTAPTDKVFNGWVVTYGDNVVVDQTAGKFNMPAGNVTIEAQWADRVYCALTLNINGATTTTNIDREEEYTLPTNVAGISGYDFYGWAEEPETDDVEEAIDILESFTPGAEEASKTLYAVFKRTDNTNPNIGKYIKVTEDQTDWSGQYLIVYENGNVALDGSLSTIDAEGNSIALTIANSIVTATTTANKTLDGSSFTIAKSNEDYTIRAAGGYYIGHSGSSNTLNSHATNSYSHEISIDNNGNVSLTCGSYILKYNSGGTGRFRYYSSDQKAVQLFKRAAAPTYYTTAPAAVNDVTYALGTNPNGTWKENEGCNNAKVKVGQTYNICTDEPVRDHHKFNGWSVMAGETQVTVTDGHFTMPEANVTITAVWVAKVENNLTYSAGTDAEGDPIVAEVEEGTEVTLKAIGTGSGQANFTKTGYNFKGWLSNGVLYKAGETFEMPANAVELVAQWKKQSVDKYTLVTNASQLLEGSKVVIAYNDNANTDPQQYLAGQLSTTSTKYLIAENTNVEFSENTVTFSNSNVIEWTLVKTENGWKLKSGDNYLGESGDNVSVNATNQTEWSMAIAENGDATLGSGNYTLRYNYSSGSPRFKTYSSTSMKLVQLYASMTAVNSDMSISEIGYVDNEVIVIGNDVTLTVDADIAPTTMIVPKGSTVTVNDNQKIDANTLIVERGGTLDIQTNGTVKTDETFVIYSTLGKGNGGSSSGNAPGSSSQIKNANKINATGDVFFELELTQETKASAGWYAFSVPFPVDAMTGVYYGNTQLQNEVGYAIMSYHGDKRAAGEYAWKKYRDIMVPGVLYIIAVGDTDYKTLRFKKHGNDAFSASTNVAVKQYSSVDITYAGWNGIGNPSMQVSYLPETDYVYYMQFLDHANNRFQIRQRSNINLVVGSAFFIQYRAADGQIAINTGVQNGANGYLAPTRERSAVEESIYEISLFNTATNEVEDNVFITAREEATNSYEIGRDVAKMIMGTAKCAQMSIQAYGKQLGAADFPLVNGQAAYPLTITAPAAGTYTISTIAQDNADLYLTQEGAIIWNLSMGEYELNLTQGTMNDYGLLLIEKTPGIATGVDEISGEKAGVQKIVIEDKVFILRGGKMYDVTGKAVK